MTSASRRRVHVATSLAIRRPRHSLTFILLGVLLGTLTVGTAAISSSARDAITESAAANLGGRISVLQTDDADAQRILARLDGTSPIVDSSGYLTTDVGSLDVTLRITDDPSLVLGTLVEGARVEGDGDVLVTRSLAQALHASVGDDVVIAQGDDSPLHARVAGIIINTADAGARTVQVIGKSSEVSSASRWVSTRDLSSAYPELEPYLSAFTAITASRKVIEEAALENLPPAVSALTYIPAGGAVIMLVLIASVAVAMIRTWSRDIDALVAAGLSAKRAWRIIATTATALLLLGALLGVAMVLAAIHAARTTISGALGQDWETISIPFLTIALLALALVALRVVAVPLGQRLAAIRTRNPSVFAFPRWLALLALLVACAAVLVIAYALHPWGGMSGDGRALALVGAIVLIASLPFLISRTVGVGLPRATRRLTEITTSSFAVVCAACAVVALGTSTWSALEFSDAAQGESASEDSAQPSGSLLISAIPNSSIDQLRQRYERLGGASITSYELTSDGDAVWRATSPAAVACGEAGGLAVDAVMECGDLLLIAIGGPGTATRSTPSLTDDGTVGLVAIDPANRTIGHALTIDATVDSDLGYLMPGIVVSPNDPTIEELAIRGSGLSMVLVEDFDALPVSDRLAMRSQVLTLSPTANLSDATLPTAYDQIRSTATGVALVGAAIAALILLLGGGAIVLAQDATRQALIDVGLASSLRVSIAARWAAVPATSLALGVVLTTAVATGGWSKPLGSVGWPWVVPYIIGLLAVLAVVRAYLQPPRYADE